VIAVQVAGQDGVVRDWVAWHGEYDDPDSALSMRLDRVAWHLSRALDAARAGQIRLVSLCAGQGRDVLRVLPGHPRMRDVWAVLVEASAENAAMARQQAASSGMTGVEVRHADASLIENIADVVPADVLLLSGIFGNVSDADIERTIAAAAWLCAEGGTVIWTRHRRPPDVTTQMRTCFESAGFEEQAFEALETEYLTSVGVHVLVERRERPPELPRQPLFTFGSHLP
jgi:ubiquinone/menaquinone biosynthesis C-methylase UbiE